MVRNYWLEKISDILSCEIVSFNWFVNLLFVEFWNHVFCKELKFFSIHLCAVFKLNARDNLFSLFKSYLIDFEGEKKELF